MNRGNLNASNNISIPYNKNNNNNNLNDDSPFPSAID
jgi:hypothetical protein